MAKAISSNTTAFTWDASTRLPLLLTEGSATSRTNYIYGPDGRPTQRIDPSGNVVYYHHDQLGSTRMITDSSGTVASTTTHDPYGNVTATTGALTQPSASPASTPTPKPDSNT